METCQMWPQTSPGVFFLLIQTLPTFCVRWILIFKIDLGRKSWIEHFLSSQMWKRGVSIVHTLPFGNSTFFSPKGAPPPPLKTTRVPPIPPLPFCGHSPKSTRGEGGGGPYPFQKSPLPPPPLNLLRKPAASRLGQASWPVACLIAGRSTPGRPPSWPLQNTRNPPVILQEDSRTPEKTLGRLQEDSRKTPGRLQEASRKPPV